MSEEKNIGEKPEEKLEEKQVSKEEKVTISKDKLDKILSLVENQGKAISEQAKKIENFEKNGIEQKPIVIKKIKEHYCMLRRFKDEIVKGFEGDVYKEYDSMTRDWKLFVDIILYSNKVIKHVDYIDFINNAEKVKAKIIKKDKKEISNIEAYINQKEPQGEFGTLITDVIVPVENIIEEYNFDVEVENLGEFRLNERAINI